MVEEHRNQILRCFIGPQSRVRLINSKMILKSPSVFSTSILIFLITQERLRGHSALLLCSGRLRLMFIQGILWPYSVLFSLNLKTKSAQEATASTGSGMERTHLIQLSSTLLETGPMSATRVLTLRRAAFMGSPRTLSPLMLGHTTVLWSSVGRYYLEMEQKRLFKVLFCI